MATYHQNTPEQNAALVRNRGKLKVWDKSCEDCAVKRGYTSEIQKLLTPFICIHQKDSDGSLRACASQKDKVKIYNE